MEGSFQIESAAISDRGLSQKRPQNEDSFLEINSKGIFAVADGVGGAQAGEVASQMAVEIVGEAFTNLRPGSDAERVMLNALEQANSAIHQMSNDLAQLSKMATTVVALHVEGNIATIGHVGDSRLYRLDSAGTIHRETNDHSMVAEEVRAGRMTEEQAENHPSKNIISRALGAERTVEVDLKTMMVNGDSTFLLCSDGVTRHIGDAEIANLLLLSEPLNSICLRIKELCYDRGAEDNLTAVIVRLSKGQPAISMKSPAETSDDFLTVPDFDEKTIAAARSSKSGNPQGEVEEDLLELETTDLMLPAEMPIPPTDLPRSVEDELDDISLHETVPAPIHYAVAEIDLRPNLDSDPLLADDGIEIIDEVVNEKSLESFEAASPEKYPDKAENAQLHTSQESVSMFGESAATDDRTNNSESSGVGKLFFYLLFLLVGTGIGLAIYHFALKPAEPSSSIPITEMRTGNIPLSAFEDNRRLVDTDPLVYLAKTPAPDDAESFYLQGRAYMLTGDYIKARSAFVAARSLIDKADSVNAKVIVSDIAIAMAITNDPTAQKNLKAELDLAKPLGTANTNTNR